MSGSDFVRVPRPDVKLTYDDFLQFPDDGQRHELIDGEHFVTPSPNLRHQTISGNLHALLWTVVLALIVAGASVRAPAITEGAVPSLARSALLACLEMFTTASHGAIKVARQEGRKLPVGWVVPALWSKLERLARHHDRPVLPDVEQQAGGHVARQQAAAAVADEGEGNAGDGHEAQHHHEVDERLAGHCRCWRCHSGMDRGHAQPDEDRLLRVVAGSLVREDPERIGDPRWL